MSYDVFISHSSADKPTIVRPLARLLDSHYKLSVWLDETSMNLGDKLHKEIGEAVYKCRCGIVVLSPDAVNAKWVEDEIGTMIARDNSGSSILIIPIYHKILPDQAHEIWPILSNRLGISSEKGMPYLARAISQSIDEFESGCDRNLTSISEFRLLPFLINREEQDEAIEKSLAFEIRKPTRPIVFIAHGNSGQCHDKYIGRLIHHSLQHIAPTFSTQIGQEIPMFWPERLDDLQSLPSRLTRELRLILSRQANLQSQSLDDNQIQQLEMLNNQLKRIPNPILSYHVTTADLKAHGERAIEGFLDYWERWPNLSSQQRMLVFLLVEYGTIKRMAFLNANSRASRIIHRYLIDAKPLLNKKRNLNCFILPRLINVTRKQTQKWIKQDLERLLPNKVMAAERCVQGVFHTSKELPLNYVADLIADAL